MTEKLRYIGPTTPEYSNGEVYPLLMAVHQGFLELKKAGGHPMKYASLAMLLQYWQPAAAVYAPLSDGSVEEVRAAYGFAS